MTPDELAAEVHRKNCIEGTHDDACTAISDMRESLADLARTLARSVNNEKRLITEAMRLDAESTLHDEFVAEIIDTNSLAIDIDELGDAQTPEDLAVAYVRALEETVVALRHERCTGCSEPNRCGCPTSAVAPPDV